MSGPIPQPDAPAGAPVEKASVFEDFIDIFYAPSTVFARRRDRSGWIPLIVVSLVVGIGFLASSGVLQPVMDAEFTRAAAKMAENPQMTPEMIARSRSVMETGGKIAAFFSTPIAIVVVGLVTWLAAKLVDASVAAGAGIMIAAYAYVPRIIQAVLMPIQLRFMAPDSLNGMTRLTAGPARFMDPDTTAPVVLALASRLDLFVLWSALLIAIGVSVVGKVSRASGWVVAIVVWLVGSLPIVFPALSQ